MTPLVFLDTETTGLRPDIHTPWEVAWVTAVHAMLCSNWLGWPGYGEGLWHYHIIDVEILAAGKLGAIPPYSSSELTAALGVVVDEATKHTALGDVEWAMALYAAAYNLEVTDGIKS